MNDDIYVTVRYKDTVFRLLFKDKQRLLELYNAINDTNYTNSAELEVITLENAVYMSMKNDVSCLLDMRMQLYEQQSTVNPNMPLRDLMYVCSQYEKYIIKKDIYSRRLIKLPTPKFIVFYNGTEKQPECQELRLSDAFEIPEEEPALELRVIQLNINTRYNSKLLAKCPSLFQYMQYVNQVREYRQKYPLKEAVQLAVDYCIEQGILNDFLLANKAEVIKMSIFEYDEELHKKTLHDEGYEDGFQDGFDDGKVSNLIDLVCRKLRKCQTPETIADDLLEDLDTVRHICDVASPFAPNYDIKEIQKRL
ncbi:MAG: hypothetical protein MR355_09335 [Lachnospiraceae bacterium]|nr:hypothetical protein [Lachnospiraceae bacterium]